MAVGGVTQAFRVGGVHGGQDCQTTRTIASYVAAQERSQNTNVSSVKARAVGLGNAAIICEWREIMSETNNDSTSQMEGVVSRVGTGNDDPHIAALAGSSKTCCCCAGDPRQCFLIRHPECRRVTDCLGGLYDAAIDEVCECGGHFEVDED